MGTGITNKIIIGVLAIVVMVACVFAGKYFFAPAPPPITIPPVQVVTPPQQVKVDEQKEKVIYIQQPSSPGSMVQFIDKNGKIIAKVGDQEVEVPSMTGKPVTSLGKDGELVVTTQSTTKIDVTDMANAQATLIANKEIDKVNAEFKKKQDKINSDRKRERILLVLGTGALIYGLNQ